MCQLQGCDCTPGSQALGLWASIRGEPFLCLHDETCANFRNATVHQDPKRWACGRRYEANPSSVSAVRLSCTRWVHVGPCCTICVREQATYTVLHRVGARGTMLHHLLTGASHITVLHRVGACGTMLHHLRKGALHVTAAYVCGPLLQRESKPYYRDANLVNSTRRAPPGRLHHVAASTAVVGAADILQRRAHNKQQGKHEFTS